MSKIKSTNTLWENAYEAALLSSSDWDGPSDPIGGSVSWREDGEWTGYSLVLLGVNTKDDVMERFFEAEKAKFQRLGKVATELIIVQFPSRAGEEAEERYSLVPEATISSPLGSEDFTLVSPAEETAINSHIFRHYFRNK